MATLRDFYRYTALGNDYLVIDPAQCSIKMTEKNIQLICHRHFGVGSDGILYGPLRNSQGEILLKIFNPDGSEAEKSGNGVRIFAKYLKDQGHVMTRQFSLQTLGGKVEVEYLQDDGGIIKVHMGKSIFHPEKIPLNTQLLATLSESKDTSKNKSEMKAENEVLRFSLKLDQEKNPLLINCVSMGNPHCVILFPQDDGENKLSAELAKKWGPLIENHPLFPNRTNMQILRVIDRGQIQIEIWERGAGYTLASGSSSCAAASVAYRLGLIDDSVKVHMPGGEMLIQLNQHNEVWMTGSVQNICSGFIDAHLCLPIL